ncbi:MAG TPA: acetyl-CoA carboxylase carboxyl transferase subunit alpha/beta [Syntrophaceae bacterium]|nr:acetyl-CoA carboxylase carboxyl transferase subunit alpha/beta [Syntrophaceae bacterium]
MEAEKRFLNLENRILYLIDIKGDNIYPGFFELKAKADKLKKNFYQLSSGEILSEMESLEEMLAFYEIKAERDLTPMEIARIVRNPQRFTLRDILDNVYDDYSELGGAGDCNIDPAIVVARADISRKIGNRIYSHQVMVIGHEKGKGEEFRNGGSAKPWGNEKALRYMKVAETEGIPIHIYISTPGAYPIEDYPGSAQQIARNLYEMTKLKVPIISVISEGGSGGAEAIGLSDMRLMLSHGYYSVISPEGAAAIEGKIPEGKKAPKELIDFCAEQLKITAQDSLSLGVVDRIIPEPPLGARKEDDGFFRRLRYEMLRATDEVVLSTKTFRTLRAYSVKRRRKMPIEGEFDVDIRWELSHKERMRLLRLRSKKYRSMGTRFFVDLRHPFKKFMDKASSGLRYFYTEVYFDLLKKHKRSVEKVIEEVSQEGTIALAPIKNPFKSIYTFIKDRFPRRVLRPIDHRLPVNAVADFGEIYVSPLANEDRVITCPNSHTHGCLDLWVPDLYGDLHGVCPNCGHHFPLEYQWYLKTLFDKGSVREFNSHIGSTNSIGYKGFDRKIQGDQKKTKRKSAIITFLARINGIELVVAMLYSNFRNGTVGAAEGEKFVLACDHARALKLPLLAYVHATGGIRIHEGTVGVVQMPKCTMAVREYIDAGGLYIVVYDNNSYAGPVASFLGCSPYQFAIKSSNIGFAGPRVIRETTGEDIPPDYHRADNALKRGHIQGIWDRRTFRKNLYMALLTMGGKNLYYR